MSCARAYWDGIAADWAGASRQAVWRRHSDAVNAGLLRDWLPPGGHGLLLKTDLFDEAVSEGMRDCLASGGWQWFGIDIAPEAVRAANRVARPVAGLAADVLHIPVADAALDAVVSLSTIDHLADDEGVRLALGEMRRVLRPGGTLVVTMDNAANPVIALRRLLPARWLNTLGLVPYQVGVAWGAGRLRRALHAERLRLAQLGFIMHCPRALAVRRAGRLAGKDAEAQSRFLATLLRFERLSRWPSRSLTGYFVAALAVKE